MTERRTEIRDATVPSAPPSTNVNVRPDGGADVQVNDPGVPEEIVEERTTTTTRRTP
ncbi:MAG TPA: hypothetical protein VKR80_06540 [Candidatus Limnocylindria bacterium]|nr:hypothetical protein [Candidatus Limnocylindria bacterium]